MEDLTTGTVESLHREILRNSGGDTRIIAEAVLHQLVFRANTLPDCVDRAAFVFWYLCAYPAFREGNLRTACAVAEHVLASGMLRIAGPPEEIRTLAHGIATYRTEPEDVSAWMRDHVKRSGTGQE